MIDKFFNIVIIMNIMLVASFSMTGRERKIINERPGSAVYLAITLLNA